jgi:hypothetical protein
MPFPPTVAELALAAQACADSRHEVAALVDHDLVRMQQQVAASARQIELVASALAAEIARRSRPELGHNGLAQKRGMRTPAALVQQLTGGTSQSARRLVRVGELVHADAPLVEPWLSPIIGLVAAGAAAVEIVDLVRAALGAPSSSVSSDALLDAAGTLACEAATLPLERLAERARELRDELDSAGVASRENERRERRYLHLFAQPDGMTRIAGLLDPESTAVLVAAIDDATSPRRGGPRFVDPAAGNRTESIVRDSRTTEQLAVDALVELVDVAVRHRGTGTVAGRRLDVRVLVTQSDLDRRAGVGFLEGQSTAVSIATVERHACDGGLVPIMFDDATGAALNLGRSQRLHSARQRTVIAARDGRCVAPACDRPPSWCEVHHIHEFSKGGSTDLADGVLLCRHHHLLVHNNGWRITRSGHAYWLVPPPDIDARQEPIPLRSKSAAVRRLVGAASG